MKKYFAALTALLITISMIFGGCISDKLPEVEVGVDGEGGSDIAPEIQTTQPTLSPDDKLIALTFDDGPHPTHTNHILDILEKHGSKATFFIVGYNIEKNTDTIKRAHDMGCEIANHTDGHKNLTKCTLSELREQVDNPNNTIKELLGSPMKLLRAPGGNFKGITQDVGMPLIQWSVDTNDWRSKDAAHKDRTEEERNAELRRIADDVVNNAKKGDIVLMHDIYDFTADLCELIIPELVEKGFKLVTVSEMYEVYGEKLEKGEVYYSVKVEEPSTAPEFIYAAGDTALSKGKYTVKTNGGTLNVRAEPNQDAVVLEKLNNGDSVTVIKSSGIWALVETENSKGWVNAAYLKKN